jgi:hypothetical protein
MRSYITVAAFFAGILALNVEKVSRSVTDKSFPDLQQRTISSSNALTELQAATNQCPPLKLTLPKSASPTFPFKSPRSSASFNYPSLPTLLVSLNSRQMEWRAFLALFRIKVELVSMIGRNAFSHARLQDVTAASPCLLLRPSLRGSS